MFFDRLFKRGARAPAVPPAGAPSVRGDPIIFFVLLRNPDASLASLASELATTNIRGKAPAEIDGDDQIVTFKLGDENCFVAHMPAPFPPSELESAMEQTWLLPPHADQDAILGSASHAIVTVAGGSGDPVGRRLALTQLASLVAQRLGALAVIWGGAHLLVDPGLFTAMAGKLDTPEAPPVLLWVNLRIGKNPDGTFHLVTRGLEGLGHREMEIPSTRRTPGDLREWLPNIIMYLLGKGPVLKHGQTIGPDAKTQYKITHGPSAFGLPGTFISLAE